MLSATFVRTVNAPGRYGDGRGGLGLSLLVRVAPRGHVTKCWTQIVRIGGRPTIRKWLHRTPIQTRCAPDRAPPGHSISFAGRSAIRQ